jgi:hypothetical protein
MITILYNQEDQKVVFTYHLILLVKRLRGLESGI